ncbi:gem-associated protein 2-like [Argiope bruennichi]|uniref:Gem-associated protein 2 like protein n=1 Tax=Argiope bruennichi TaxID=94029 RepID=A0A8T0FDD1_ARGBR|nr:gem-associated protein 2-like [Argiope bruennichi]KAF8787310.1 Gem-associated protein 2 like protein [Argiope bruennichi]
MPPKPLLQVEPATRHLDIHTRAQDGSEFIHISRMEDAEVNLERNPLPEAPVEDEDKWKRLSMRPAIYQFTRRALEINTKRDQLKIRFPLRLETLLDVSACRHDWCAFCLGSKLCSEIYSESYLAPIEEIAGQSPYLSVVLHFDYYTLVLLLKYLHEWFIIIGMKEAIGAWVYSVVACMKKSIGSRVRRLVENFYDDCEEYLKVCEDETEIDKLYLISGILDSYFNINLERASEVAIASENDLM